MSLWTHLDTWVISLQNCICLDEAPLLNWLQPALLSRNLKFQAVKVCWHLTNSKMHSCSLKPQPVTITLLEPRRLVVFRCDLEIWANREKISCVVVFFLFFFLKGVSKTCLTLVIIVELHVEVDLFGKRVQVLQQEDKLPDEQHRGCLDVSRHLHFQVVPAV